MMKTQLPGQLYRAEQVRALDRKAIDDYNIPGIVLMERAGMAAFRYMRREWPRAQSILVFCGAGNNGGDGFVVARLAREMGLEVQVVLLAEVSRLKGDAKTAYEKMLQSGLDVRQFDPSMGCNVDIIVDGLLGTGLTGAVGERYALAINWINLSVTSNAGRTRILALDIPSGLHADTGVSQGVTVQANATVTFIGMKQGMFTADGPDYCGQLVFDDLQVDASVYKAIVPACELLSDALIRQLFLPRKNNSHKFSFGHALVIGGNDGMIGAVRMAAEAALRAGAGVVSVATRPEHVSAVVSQRPEIMCYGVESHHQLKPLLEKASCIAIGPGLGRDAWADEIMCRVLETSLPLVVDADALNLLAKDRVTRKNWILTPHPGEAARLLDTDSQTVQGDRFEAIKRIQQQYGGVGILKGVGSLVIDQQSNVFLCPYGNAGMASGGMGDVLTGIAVACIAQGFSLGDSARLATIIHSRAADLAATDGGSRGLLATDLFPYIRKLVA